MNYKDINFDAIYEGYIWMSNSNKPDVINNSVLDKNKFEQGNPFVIEGQLYNEKDRKSISIKYIDGRYLIQCYDITDTDLKEKSYKQYISNRIDRKKLKFVQRWIPKADVLCEGMKALQPAELVFIGFGETINEED